MKKKLILLTLFITLFAANNASASRPAFLFSRTTGRCTAQYWSSRTEAWPRMVPQTSTVSNIFGSRIFERYRSGLTLLESTARNDDENVFVGLLKQAIAALLNSYSRKGFGYSAWEVKSMFIQGLVSEEAAAKLAQSFSLANEACN
ncbi:uncharacterized protein LOC126655982 [Mercurialis annua]|uniref:uncharacterized protein LOC126655982 n=1 Tax=Mercurialis annua TaxID=3986 RepID=UPI002160065C|nr:uncharacterized protein LOC126655982 [Mercurialis annua]